jgi:hypothetical protein
MDKESVKEKGKKRKLEEITQCNYEIMDKERN